MRSRDSGDGGSGGGIAAEKLTDVKTHWAACSSGDGLGGRPDNLVGHPGLSDICELLYPYDGRQWTEQLITLSQDVPASATRTARGLVNVVLFLAGDPTMRTGFWDRTIIFRLDIVPKHHDA